MWEAAGLCSGERLRGLRAADLRAVGAPAFPLPQDPSSSPCDAVERRKKLNSVTANPGLVGADPPLLTDQVCGGEVNSLQDPRLLQLNPDLPQPQQMFTLLSGEFDI